MLSLHKYFKYIKDMKIMWERYEDYLIILIGQWYIFISRNWLSWNTGYISITATGEMTKGSRDLNSNEKYQSDLYQLLPLLCIPIYFYASVVIRVILGAVIYNLKTKTLRFDIKRVSFLDCKSHRLFFMIYLRRPFMI